jgi:hypothetical protein
MQVRTANIQQCHERVLDELHVALMLRPWTPFVAVALIRCHQMLEACVSVQPISVNEASVSGGIGHPAIGTNLAQVVWHLDQNPFLRAHFLAAKASPLGPRKVSSHLR